MIRSGWLMIHYNLFCLQYIGTALVSLGLVNAFVAMPQGVARRE